MEIERLAEWNPWWESKELISELKGKERSEYKYLINSIDLREVTIIVGVRRSGKSTLMFQMVDHLLKKGVNPKQILFVNLEDKKFINESLDDIYRSYRENINLDEKAYIFLDEVHRKPGWELWIRKKYDLKSKDKFVVSGSCSYLLKKEYSTLLTGRNVTFEVFPLSFEEFLSFKNIKIEKNNIRKGIVLEKTKFSISKSMQEYLYFGGFPEIFFKPKTYKNRVLEQYFDDILYKDIVDRYNLNAQKAKELALFFMSNFTNVVSLRNLRNSLKLSYDTIKDYTSHYKEAFLFFTLEYFSYSLKEQKTIASKIYCIDNGLRNAVSFKFSKDEGRLAENLVFIELVKSRNEIYYWKEKGEVDFVMKNKDNSLTAINVCYSDDIPDREFQSLLEFKKKFKSKAKKLVVLTKDTERRENGISLVPLWKWLLEQPVKSL